MTQADFDFTAPAPGRPTAAPEAEVLTVTDLTRRVRGLLESEFGRVWVRGEVSNLRAQASGHRYFTLKDESSQLACVLFARQAAAALGGIALADGIGLEVNGELTVYEARGQYQLIVRRVRAAGAGSLHAKFEALKQKLAAEGLFDQERKKPLPKFPRTVGVVTSPTGAALRDFLNVLHRRHPGIVVVVNPVRVQGRGAAAEIAKAVGEFANPSGPVPVVDVIVVTRGGGSLEDLWEFNEEVVARAVAASPVPVVSAVGHEIDFTICDFASDFRAPTPSAAAEILSADAAAVLQRVRADAGRLSRAAAGAVSELRMRLAAGSSSALFREPARLHGELSQRADRGWDDLARGALTSLERRSVKLDGLAGRISPAGLLARIEIAARRLLAGTGTLSTCAQNRAAAARARLEAGNAGLSAADPAATLRRGFTITTGPGGRPVSSAAGLKPGDTLKTRFGDGEVVSTVGEVEERKR